MSSYGDLLTARAQRDYVAAERDQARAKLDKIRDFCLNQIDGDAKDDSAWSMVIAFIEDNPWAKR